MNLDEILNELFVGKAHQTKLDRINMAKQQILQWVNDEVIDVIDDLMDQDTVLTIADDMEIELMSDDAGEIIIFDHKDLVTFLDIINDNFVSGGTGRHYLAKSKKAIEE